jgi:hypothetical protein
MHHCGEFSPFEPSFNLVSFEILNKHPNFFRREKLTMYQFWQKWVGLYIFRAIVSQTHLVTLFITYGMLVSLKTVGTHLWYNIGTKLTIPS